MAIGQKEERRSPGFYYVENEIATRKGAECFHLIKTHFGLSAEYGRVACIPSVGILFISLVIRSDTGSGESCIFWFEYVTVSWNFY